MDPDPDFVARCVDQHRKGQPVPLIADVLGAAPVDVSRALRRAGALADVQPWEVVFVADERARAMPERALATHLGMTPGQLDQIRRRYRLPSPAPTRELCAARTRWLLEERLRWPVDDALPRLIGASHFAANGLGSLIEFAAAEKGSDPVGRHFSAVALAVGLAYPGRFRPWQFRHAKTNTFFDGAAGRRNLLDALRWFVEEKLGIAPAALPLALANPRFLAGPELEAYGLGAHWWRRHWGGRRAMLEDFARHAGVPPVAAATGSARVLVSLPTGRARRAVAADGRNPGCCAVPGCAGVGGAAVAAQVHHIVPKATRVVPRGFNIHAAYNLVPLCPGHHAAADRFAPRDFDLSACDTLRAQLLAKIATGSSPLGPPPRPGG